MNSKENQYDIFDSTYQAKINRENGINNSLLNAESVNHGWGDEALNMVRNFLERVSGDNSFLGEDVRIFSEKHGLARPPSLRAWGGVMIRAAKLKLIKKVGWGPTSNPLAHRTPATLWMKG